MVHVKLAYNGTTRILWVISCPAQSVHQRQQLSEQDPLIYHSVIKVGSSDTKVVNYILLYIAAD